MRCSSHIRQLCIVSRMKRIVLPLRDTNPGVSRLGHSGGSWMSGDGEIVVAAAAVRRCRPANTALYHSISTSRTVRSIHCSVISGLVTSSTREIELAR